MKKIPFIFLLIFFSQRAFAQYDTIYSNDERIACSVKEVTPDAVKFSYPNEDLVNSVYKNTIQKIVFKSGRVQIFAESTYFKTVNSVEDFDNVSLSHVAGEVQGLYKIGEVGAKARGTTALANMEKVKERAEMKIKIQAAMMGANIVYLTQFATSDNRLGNRYNVGQATATNISGVAYSNKLPSFDGFENLINAKSKLNFIYNEVDKLGSGDYECTRFTDTGAVIINRIYNDNGFIMIDASITGFDNKTFRVISYNTDGFILECIDNSDITENSIYNVRVRL
jgi:hypothetical protein